MLDLPAFANNAAAIEFQPKANAPRLRHEGRSRPFDRAPMLEEHVAFSMAVLRPVHPVTRIRGPMKHTFVITGEIGACPQK